MKLYRRLLAVLLALVLLVQFSPRANACGPDLLTPIFVFNSSPDIPFGAFTQGKLGIVQPTFGRKSLVISYRYLNGGSFTSDEQSELVDALKGKGPDEDSETAIKAWIETRKTVMRDEEKPPGVYNEHRYGGYSFFPNCTRNAFEVASETLKERVASYGADDPGVHEWLQGQDRVFENCDGSATMPVEVGPSAPLWLRKDRDYQIAAAFFYSLNFREARLRFARIADDGESPWQQTADYLVARTLVRAASLENDSEKKRASYDQAESHLINLLGHAGKFLNASRKLLGLVKYRIHPEERLGELSRVLEHQTGNDNLRQDLIDYSWLLDNFVNRARKEEEERQRRLKPPEPAGTPRQLVDERYNAVQRGELISIWFAPFKSNGESDYEKSINWYFKPEVSMNEVLQQAETDFARKLTPAEAELLQERYKFALESRLWNISPNRKFMQADYEGCYETCRDVPLELIPAFMRIDSLKDWIITFQSADPTAYVHALKQWKETHSLAWLVAALAKAQHTSRGLLPLVREAEMIAKDSAAFPTVVYHLIRLRIDAGKRAEARKLADEVMSNLEALPVSSQNQFRKQRISLAETVSEFLRFAGSKPVAFYEYGKLGTIREIMELEKGFWDAQDYKTSKEQYEKEIDEQFQELLKWDERLALDDDTAEALNWNLPISLLVTASKDSALPDYLQRELILTAWTRAVVLENDEVARAVASDVIKVAPEMSSLMNDYVSARNRQARADAALFVLLKFPTLSPLVPSGLPLFSTAEKQNYYFEMSWWCPPSDTEYDDEGNEVPKKVTIPGFLSAEMVATAKKERSALQALGNGKSFLGHKVVDWANRSPEDPRVPEAVFIAAKANQSYKYGCGMWEQDEETLQKLVTLLQEKYVSSQWTAKWNEDER